MALRILKLIRQAPVTLACVTCCAVLLMVTSRPQQTALAKRQALHRWGAVVELAQTRLSDGEPLDPETALHGPISLWQGQWWRIPVCAFHHVDVWHWLMNSLAAVYLGRLLEPRWGSWSLLCFLPGAVIIPLLPEFLIGNYVLGFSGVVAAMFGALCVLRGDDESLREEFPDEIMYAGGALFAFGVLSSALDLMPVANLAHVTGLFWGALAGWSTTAAVRGGGRPRLAYYFMGLFVIPALWFAVHPFWNGRYLWFVASQPNLPDEPRIDGLRSALRCDPQLAGAWRQLAGEYLRRGEPLQGWRCLLQGLLHNPGNPDLLRDGRKVWRLIIVALGRDPARRALQDVFGEMAAAWEQRFRDAAAGSAANDDFVDPSARDVDPMILFPLDQALDLRLPEVPDELNSRDGKNWRMPPAGDAVEGERL